MRDMGCKKKNYELLIMNYKLSIFNYLLLFVFLFVSCKTKTPPPNPPVQVNLYSVKAQRVLSYDEYPATTQALSQVHIRHEVQGYITAIFFTEGSYVKKGQKF